MRVSIVGSGYVGTTVAACLADHGHDVVNVEIDEDVVAAINEGTAPIHEPGLADRLERTVGSSGTDADGGRLRATTDYGAVCETDVTLLCLPTPQADDGSIDLTAIRSGSDSLGRALAEKGGEHVVAVKSTVLPGTTEEVVTPTIASASGRTPGEDLLVASNPEFLRMGSAVSDFESPDKVVVGATDERAYETLRSLYERILEREGTHLVETDVREGELIKYANNAFLAAKVSMANELGNVCKRYGADAYEVLDAVGLDGRIDGRFLRSGLGWGGSCFPKDVDALRAGAREQGYEPHLLDAVVAVNDEQPRRLVDLLEHRLRERDVDLESARVAVLGLAFKPHTDDVRESRALEVIDVLESRGTDVIAYDPVAAENARAIHPDLESASSAREALEGADAAVVATAWPAFDDLEFDGMAHRVLVDGRRIDVDRSALDVYEGLCW